MDVTNSDRGDHNLNSGSIRGAFSRRRAQKRRVRVSKMYSRSKVNEVLLWKACKAVCNFNLKLNGLQKRGKHDAHTKKKHFSKVSTELVPRQEWDDLYERALKAIGEHACEVFSNTCIQ
jgi:hypothetical protein